MQKPDETPRATLDACASRETRIYREVSFDLPTFDLLKAWQRRKETELRRHLTNAEALRLLIHSHPEV